MDSFFKGIAHRAFLIPLEHMKNVVKASSDSYKVTLHSTWCLIYKAEHRKKDGRAIFINSNFVTYNCLDDKCSSHKEYKGWTFSKEEKEKWFSDSQQHKEKKRKRLNSFV
jgi:hypothetical protein